MTYPNTIDSFRTPVGYTGGPVLDINKLNAGDQNNMADSVEGIMTELGTLPKGSYGSVKLLLEALTLKTSFEMDYVQHAQSVSVIGWNEIKKNIITVQNASNFFITLAMGYVRNDDSRVNLLQFRLQNDFGTFFPICAEQLNILSEYGHFSCMMLDSNVAVGSREFKLQFNPQRVATQIFGLGLLTFGFYV